MSNDLPIITGEILLLRPITLDDTDLIVKWRNTPRVKKNFIFRDTFTSEIHERWMNTKIKKGEAIQYIIEAKGSPIGSVYFKDITELHHSGEFGIFIGEENSIGKGFGFKATKMFVNFGFSYLNLHRISLRVLSGNRNAYKIYLSVGFKQEGVFRDMVYIDGRYHDVIFMAKLNDNA